MRRAVARRSRTGRAGWGRTRKHAGARAGVGPTQAGRCTRSREPRHRKARSGGSTRSRKERAGSTGRSRADLPKADAALRPGRWDAPRRTNERQMRRTRIVSRRASVRARPTRTAPRRRDKLEGRPDIAARHEPRSSAARQAMRLGHCAACRTSEASRVQCARGPGPPSRQISRRHGLRAGAEPGKAKRSDWDNDWYECERREPNSRLH